MSETEGTAPVAEELEGTEEVVPEELRGAEAVPDEVAAQMEAEEAVAAAMPAAVVDARASGKQARVFLCDRGHRTDAIWSIPSACHARPLRSGPECGRPIYPITELPEQVQKALNPLKASKKASKK
jgi:hypothetical protein